MTTTEKDNFEEFLAKLDPKTAREIRTAAETETIRYPLASEGLTRLLDGGITAGAVTTIYGNYSSGKSALMMESIGFWQRMGLVCLYVDVEGTFKKEWAARLGVDVDRLWVVTGKSSGKIESQIREFLQKGIDVIVIDSISDIMPEVFIDKKGELNEQDGRKQTGAHAKAITALINGIHYHNERTAVVLISQTTTFIGQTHVEQKPHGGNKTEFGSSVMIKLTSSNSAGAPIMGHRRVGDRLVESPVGREVTAYLKKNKLGIPYTQCKYNFYYAGDFVGIDRADELVRYGLELGVLEGKGAWIERPSTGDKWNGRPKLTRVLNEDPALMESIKKEIHTIETGEVFE